MEAKADIKNLISFSGKELNTTFMTEGILDIYVNKNALFRSIIFNAIGAIVLGCIIYYYFNPKNISIHPEVSLIVAIPLISLGGIFLIYWIGLCLWRTIKSIIELPSTPKLVYSISTLGFHDHRTNRRFNWHDFKSLNVSAGNGDIIFRLSEKSRSIVIEKRGLSSDDYSKILSKIPPIVSS